VTIGSFLGVLGVLGFVLMLLLLTLRALKRFTPLGGDGRTRLPLEVVQRLPLGPRQGLAIVRMGDALVAISIGEGGVRRIAELPASLVVDRAVAPSTNGNAARPDFRAMLRTAFRGASLALVFALAAGRAGAQVAPPVAAGQTKAPVVAPKAAAVIPPKTTPAVPQGTATNTTPHAADQTHPQSVARVDTMLSKLAPRLDLRVGNDQAGGLRLSGTVGIVVMMGLLTLLPTLVLMMTGFTRIFIVLQFLRQAIGTQSAPPTQLIAGLAMLLTGFVMAPTLSEVNRTALQPWMDGKIEQTQMLAEGVKPFRTFMLRQTRDSDLETFMELSHEPRVASAEEVPLIVLMSAFVSSELRTSFQLGFALFLPFIVIDIVVASVLMSMGMMMVPPVMISLPFKLLLFVLVDGWSLVIQGLVQSFR
jgi:flagellar biosynthesis protein FliP